MESNTVVSEGIFLHIVRYWCHRQNICHRVVMLSELSPSHMENHIIFIGNTAKNFLHLLATNNTDT